MKSYEDIKLILEQGTFDKLIGVIEDDWIEFKGVPYKLDSDFEKQEFAKDISGLANADGGIILIGVKTELNDTHRGEEVLEIRPFKESLVDIKRYFDILGSWVYPSIQHIDIKWFPSSSNSQKGIVAIQISKQTHIKAPFLITKTIEDTGRKSTIVFGYVERKRTNVTPISVQELHLTLREGMQSNAITKQNENIQELLSQILEEKIQETAVDIGPLRAQRVSEALLAAGLHNRPSFTLTAIPSNSIEVQGLFESRDSKLVQLLEKPPELRYGGFDINMSTSTRIVHGQLRRAISEEHGSLELWKDGTLIFTVTGDSNFLSWGRYSEEANYLRISPIALIESTYLFVELSNHVYSQHTNTIPSEIEYALELKNMTIDGTPCKLFPGQIGSLVRALSMTDAPDSALARSIICPGSGLVSGKIAFELVREVYRWFGYEDSLVPYTEKINGNLEVSANQIRTIQG